jgi:hypothetical protein
VALGGRRRRYLHSMGPLKTIASLALALAAAPSTAQPLAHSRELWATVDVCNPKNQPNTIGIRGSMPGDSRATDVLYMRFRVQYLDPSTGKWLELGQNADSGFLKVGSGLLTRQAGRSFQLAPPSGKSAYTLRGYVIFQWRRGPTVLESTTRPTSAGHTSLAGADPRGFSAATCVLS